MPSPLLYLWNMAVLYALGLDELAVLRLEPQLTLRASNQQAASRKADHGSLRHHRGNVFVSCDSQPSTSLLQGASAGSEGAAKDA